MYQQQWPGMPQAYPSYYGAPGAAPGWPTAYPAPPAPGVDPRLYMGAAASPVVSGLPLPPPPKVEEEYKVPHYDYDDDPTEPKNIVEQRCDGNYNLNEMLANNIQASEYFRQLHEYTFYDVIEEIKSEVHHLEPFVVGKQRLPSTAFCLLYKLFTFKLTKKQLHSMLNMRDFPYVRGMALLYLRLVAAPETLWQWFELHVDDHQKFSPSGDRSVKQTMGDYAVELLTNHQYFGTMLKRIPLKWANELKMELARAALKKERASEHEKFRRDLEQGMAVEAEYSQDGKWYDAVIETVLDNGNFFVTYTEYGNQEELGIESIRLKKTSSSSSRRSRSTSRGRSDRKRGRTRSRSRDRDRKDRDRRSRSSSRGRGGKRRSREDSEERELRERAEAFGRKDREKALATGRNYAQRPSSLKTAISMKLTVATNRTRSRTPPPERRREPRVDHSRRPSSPPRRTERSAEQAARMAKIRAQYGDASANASKPEKSKRTFGRDADMIRLGF